MAARMSGGDVGIGQRQVRHRGTVRPLVFERSVVALEHRDEQRQRQERVRTQLEQSDVVVLDQRLAFVRRELLPGAVLRGRAVQQLVRDLGLPPGDRAGRVRAVPLHQVRVAVDGEQEFIQQILAHARAPFGYQVKYASMVWNRSRWSTWSAFTPSPATPTISMKSMKPCVALPGACRLSRVTSARHPSMSPEAIQSTAFRSNSGSGPCSPNCRGPPSSSERWPVPMMATRLSAGQDSTSSRMVR